MKSSSSSSSSSTKTTNQSTLTQLFKQMNLNTNTNTSSTKGIKQPEKVDTKTTGEISTYLGLKGYTIYKESLDMEEQTYIRKTLSVKPFIPKSPIQLPSFPVYRENANKFYIPRYFGLENYGEPDDYRIPDGEHINLDFNGSLRPYQEQIVQSYISKVNDKIGGGGLIEVGCGAGKTVCALNIISRIKRKTLIIVHKGFLLNQWVERIEQFLPHARVGKIQGKIIDIENKDIVIGMLQSLSMKEYDASLFQSFGLTVIDECHHISSEVFCRSLIKIVTKFTLGLSATMERKDGLSHVFKMFLGEIVFSQEREPDESVLVQAIEYRVNDDEFNETTYDYRGNPQYSTMITKLCDYSRRTEFILEVLKKELQVHPSQQIMILGQNKSILIYLHDAIEHRQLASVGYYVGGMKEEQLKKSEEKQVIIATYAMASEGLDIKTLTTLFLATPRTDITQSVGRILRVKHNRPLIVDFIDTHDVFQNQWKKRLAFYRKNKYRVLHTNNNKYLSSTNTNIWNELTKKTKRGCSKQSILQHQPSDDSQESQDSQDEHTPQIINIDTTSSQTKSNVQPPKLMFSSWRKSIQERATGSPFT
jgi:superfamily II DNA or RNA helicase